MTGWILSLSERLDAHPDRSGAGVCMAFIDTGFFPHPDLARPKSRIRAFVDVTRDAPRPEDFLEVDAHSWHGTMTACCAAGNGYLSHGRYRGLAHRADVVLLQAKAGAAAALRGAHVAAALRFVLRHRELGVRIVNVSLGVGWDDPAANDVERAVEEVSAAGILVVAAVGNTEGAAPSPPASAARALAVGGIDDGNTRRASDDERFPSNAGARSGRAPKPDLLAPAAWLPAPMVPGTLVAREAPQLFQLLSVLEEAEADIQFRKGRSLDPSVREEASLQRMLDAVKERITTQKFISASYQHVDGTSFAAPIVASVAAQMIEANPALTAVEVRKGLIETCRPLPDVPALLQGAGVVQPRIAVEWALGSARKKP